MVPRSGGLHTLYISPLKALAVDIARNLETPIAERTGRALEAWRPSLKRTMGKAIAQEMQRMLREDAEVQARIRTQVMHLIDAQKSLA